MKDDYSETEVLQARMCPFWFVAGLDCSCMKCMCMQTYGVGTCRYSVESGQQVRSKAPQGHVLQRLTLDITLRTTSNGSTLSVLTFDHSLINSMVMHSLDGRGFYSYICVPSVCIELRYVFYCINNIYFLLILQTTQIGHVLCTFSALMLLGSRKGIRPVKTEW